MTCDSSVWKVFEFNLLPILSKAFPSSKLQQSHYHLDVLHHGSCVTTESLLTRNAVCCWPNFTLPSQTLPLSRHMSHAAWLYLCKHMLYVFRFFLNSELLFYCFYFCLITRKLLTTTVQQIRVPLFLRVVKVVARALCTGHEHDQQADQQQSSHQVFMHFGALIFTTTSQSASTKPTICSLPVITRREIFTNFQFPPTPFLRYFQTSFPLGRMYFLLEAITKKSTKSTTGWPEVLLSKHCYTVAGRPHTLCRMWPRRGRRRRRSRYQWRVHSESTASTSGTPIVKWWTDASGHAFLYELSSTGPGEGSRKDDRNERW